MIFSKWNSEKMCVCVFVCVCVVTVPVAPTTVPVVTTAAAVVTTVGPITTGTDTFDTASCREIVCRIASADSVGIHKASPSFMSAPPVLQRNQHSWNADIISVDECRKKSFLVGHVRPELQCDRVTTRRNTIRRRNFGGGVRESIQTKRFVDSVESPVPVSRTMYILIRLLPLKTL